MNTMKIWERIIGRRLIREETTIGDEQLGFIPGRDDGCNICGAATYKMEKHREIQKGLAVLGDCSLVRRFCSPKVL